MLIPPKPSRPYPILWMPWLPYLSCL